MPEMPDFSSTILPHGFASDDIRREIFCIKITDYDITRDFITAS